MKSNASLIYNFFLVIGDFLALVAAFALAYIIRGNLSNVPVAHPIPSHLYLEAFFALVPFCILIFAVLGLYNNSIVEKRFQELGRLLIGSFVGLLFIISYGYAVNKTIFPARLVPVYAFGLAFIFLVLIRNMVREIRITLFSYNVGITNLLIVGDTKVTKDLIENLVDSKRSGYKIVGVVANKPPVYENHPKIPIFESFEQAVAVVRTRDIHSIVQTQLYSSNERNNQILEYAQTNHISFRFVPGNSELFVGNITVELFRSSIPVIAVHLTPLFGWGRVVKRIFDLIIGSISLIIALPLILIISVINLLTTGSVFFRQKRLTRFNNEFKVYKFRSQYKKYDGTTPEQAFALMGKPELAKQYRNNGDYLQKDPRVTPFGKLLRSTSLDELPQLLNVLRGDISLVGPRALIPEELGKYEKKHHILSVKSGLTGLAQVSGRRDISFEERRRLDLYYVQNWSIWLDLVILAKTFKAVFSKSGAK